MANRLPEKVYQLHISLKYIKPKIWRRFLVPDDFTLAKLHKVIQIVMGWEDYHLHEFDINGTKFGIPDEEWDDVEIENEKKTRLYKVDLDEGQSFEYTYDFGDNWQHTINVEKIFQPKAGEKYPKSVEGKRACPPEDCFGPPGYEDLILLTKRPKDKLDGDDLERLKWLGADFDFEYFSVDQVNSVLWKQLAR